MRRFFRSRPTITEETHRATTFEIFFDIVFIFAITRIIAFMGQPPTPLTLVQGLILLILLFYSWSNYTWLGNQTRADTGPIRAGMIIAMAAIFVASLVIPGAWQANRSGESIHAPLILALAYFTLRITQLTLYLYVAAENRRLRLELIFFAIPTALSSIPLFLGALLGGTAQTLLWLTALAIEFVGARIALVVTRWQLRSSTHIAERHGLVLIIALAESLVSVGTGAGLTATSGPVLLAALLSLTVTICLWWLYFTNAAPAANQAFARTPPARLGQRAADAYILTHLCLIAGIIYVALGIEQVLAHVVHDPSGQPAGEPLNWASTVALYGGLFLYLVGRLVFLRLTIRSNPPAQFVAAGTVLLLLPAARFLPALAALGLLAALVVVLARYEGLRPPGRPEGVNRPATAAR